MFYVVGDVSYFLYPASDFWMLLAAKIYRTFTSRAK